MKWFCSKCWRGGELFCGKDEALAEAHGAHLRYVNSDMKAERIPAGMDPGYANAAFMDKYPAVYCAGDIKLGDPPPNRRARFDKSLMPTFDFEAKG